MWPCSVSADTSKKANLAASEGPSAKVTKPCFRGCSSDDFNAVLNVSEKIFRGFGVELSLWHWCQPCVYLEEIQHQTLCKTQSWEMSDQKRIEYGGAVPAGSLLQVRNVRGFKQSSGHRWDFLPVFGITGIFFTLFHILHTGGSRGKVSAVSCCFQLSLPAVSQFQSNTHASAWAWRQTAEGWWFGWTQPVNLISHNRSGVCCSFNWVVGE